MKRVDIPLSQLSLAQKLDLMETLWANLTRDETKLESPAWHETILKASLINKGINSKKYWL